MYHLLQQKGHTGFPYMVHIRLVNLGILELDGVRQKTTQTTAPLDYASDCNSEHQVVALQVILLWFAELFEIFEMLGTFIPRQSLTELSSWSFKI